MIKLLEGLGKNYIYIVLALWIASETFFSSTAERFFFWNTEDANDFMAYLILAFLLIQIVFFQQYKARELMIILIISIPIAIATIKSSYNTMMATWIFIVATKYLDFDKVIKISYYIQLIIVLLVIYMFFTGIIDEYTMYRGNLLRHSLGFSHPNQLGMRVFQLAVSRCYLKRSKIGFFDVFVVLAAALFINSVANSKTSYYSLIILSILMGVHILHSMIGNKGHKFASVMVFGAIVANFGSVILSFVNVKKYALLSKFDVMMSKRFSASYRTMRYYGVSIWGQDIKKIVKRHVIGKHYRFFLDNAFMTILLRYGVVVFILFSALFIITMIYLKEKKQYMLLEMLFLYSIYGVMENNFFSISHNLFLLVLSYPIYRRIFPEDVILFSKIRIIA